MSDKKPFSGDGFSQEPLSSEELAGHREAHREVSDKWPTIEGLHNMARGGKTFAAIVTICAVVGAAAAWAAKQGLI